MGRKSFRRHVFREADDAFRQQVNVKCLKDYVRGAVKSIEKISDTVPGLLLDHTVYVP